MDVIKKKNKRNALKENYYPNQVPYYPGKITSSRMLHGLAKKTGDSISGTIDRILNSYFTSLPKSEIEILLFFADQRE